MEGLSPEASVTTDRRTQEQLLLLRGTPPAHSNTLLTQPESVPSRWRETLLVTAFTLRSPSSAELVYQGRLGFSSETNDLFVSEDQSTPAKRETRR